MQGVAMRLIWKGNDKDLNLLRNTAPPLSQEIEMIDEGEGKLLIIEAETRWEVNLGDTIVKYKDGTIDVIHKTKLRQMLRHKIK